MNAFIKIISLISFVLCVSSGVIGIIVAFITRSVKLLFPLAELSVAFCIIGVLSIKLDSTFKKMESKKNQEKMDS